VHNPEILSSADIDKNHPTCNNKKYDFHNQSLIIQQTNSYFPPIHMEVLMSSSFLSEVGGKKIADIHMAAGSIVDALIELSGRGERTAADQGGCLTIFDNTDGKVIMSPDIICFPVGNTGYLREVSLEQGRRLFSNPGHVSSHQSSDHSKRKYGGSIRAGKLIISFFGLTRPDDKPDEHGNEAVALILALKHGWSTMDYAERIASLSNNGCFPRLLDRVKPALAF
jgi:hypothetical protein